MPLRLIGSLLLAAWVLSLVLVAVAVPAFHLLLAIGATCLIVAEGRRG